MKKGLGITILVIILILAIGITIFSLWPNEPLEYGKRALEQDNASVCLETPMDLGGPMACYRYAAHEIRYLSFCDALEENWGNCYTAFITVRQCLHGEILCDTIGPQERRNNCYEWTAIAKNDKSLCEMIVVDPNDDPGPSLTYDDGAIEECKFNVDEQNSQQGPCTFTDWIAK
jgi:hypothetical protein